MSILTALHAITSKEHFKSKTEAYNFDKTDNIIIPYMDGNDNLFKEMIDYNDSNDSNLTSNFFIKLKCLDKNNKSVESYAKIMSFESKTRNVVLPKLLIDKLNLDVYQEYRKPLINIKKINQEELQLITRITFRISLNIMNPIDVLQFELRNRHIVSLGEVITVSIFEKSYEFMIFDIECEGIKCSQGILYDDSLERDIDILFTNEV